MGSRGWLRSASLAGLAYAAIVFAAGFALGAMRLLLLVPRLGSTVPVMLEAPVMLALSWWVCRWCIGRFRVNATWRARLLMGALAFLVLQLAEVTLAASVFNRSPRTYLLGTGTLPGAIGIAAQLATATWPLLQGRRGTRA